MAAFLARIFYARTDAAKESDWGQLRDLLGQHPDRIRVFYLATSPDLYGPVSRNLGEQGLVTRELARRAREADRPRPALRPRHQRRGGPGLRREPDLPHRPLSGKGNGPEPARAALRQLDLRAALERRRDRSCADHGGRDGRRGRARRLLRSLRRIARHGAEPSAAASLPARDGKPGIAQRRRGARREAEGPARAPPDRAARGHRTCRCAASTRMARSTASR